MVINPKYILPADLPDAVSAFANESIQEIQLHEAFNFPEGDILLFLFNKAEYEIVTKVESLILKNPDFKIRIRIYEEEIQELDAVTQEEYLTKRHRKAEQSAKKVAKWMETLNYIGDLPEEYIPDLKEDTQLSDLSLLLNSSVQDSEDTELIKQPSDVINSKDGKNIKKRRAGLPSKGKAKRQKQIAKIKAKKLELLDEVLPANSYVGSTLDEEVFEIYEEDKKKEHVGLRMLTIGVSRNLHRDIKKRG